MISFLTMSKIVRAIFYPYSFEIHVESSQNFLVIVQGASKEMIWQTALDFEVASVKVGYGFGKNGYEAHIKAQKMFRERTALKEE